MGRRLALASVASAMAVVAAGSSSQGPLALDRPRGELWVVNQDVGTVSVVATDSLMVLAEIGVGSRPRAIVLAGRRALVTDRAGDALWVIDAPTRVVTTIVPICHGPEGLAIADGTGAVVIACQHDDAVVLLDGATLVVTGRIAVGDGPRAVAIAPGSATAYVAHFVARGAGGQVTAIDLDRRSVEAVIELPPSTSGGKPNLLRADDRARR